MHNFHFIFLKKEVMHFGRKEYRYTLRNKILALHLLTNFIIWLTIDFISVTMGSGKNKKTLTGGIRIMKKKFTTKEMTLCALFTVLIAVGAFIKIPVPVVPFTLQFLFTMMAGLLLGGRLGALSVGLYAVLGLAGLPIFAEGGGFWYVLKPSFGYIIGFVLGSYVTGRMTEHFKKLTFGKVLAANLTGLAIVYGMGMVYYYIISNFVIDTPIGLWPLFLYCFLLAVPGDICLCFLAAGLAKRLRPAISNM